MSHATLSSFERMLRERKFSRVRDRKMVARVREFLSDVSPSLPVCIMSEERLGYRTDFIFVPETKRLWHKTAHALELTLPVPCRDGTTLANEARWHVPRPHA